MYIFFIVIGIIIYYLHSYFKSHFWYNFTRTSKKRKFYVGSLNKNIKSKSILSNQELIKLEKLYKHYFPNITINQQKIKNFLNQMPNPLVIYMDMGDTIVASVFNSIIDATYRKEKIRSNFVDYAVVNRLSRHRGLFVDLMNWVSYNSNCNGVDVIIFKIDMHPIPSNIGGYSVVSSYYYIERDEIGMMDGEVNLYEWKGDENKYLSKFLFYAPLDRNILANNEERITLECNTTIVNLKWTGENHMEVMYILNGDDKNLGVIFGYIKMHYRFKYLVLDDIGDNGLCVDLLNMKKNYDVYHYMLGMDMRLKKKEFYYYF